MLLPRFQQVVQFLTNVTSIDPERLPYKLNSLLPHDIRVKWMRQTAPDFNVTVTARHKVGGWVLEVSCQHERCGNVCWQKLALGLQWNRRLGRGGLNTGYVHFFVKVVA